VTNPVSSLSTGEIIASFAAFWIVYLGLFTAWVAPDRARGPQGPRRDAQPGRQ
jgi:hypothetical protein